MLRPLRITVSVVCGICCVMLVVLWVRSFWWQDLIAAQVLPSVCVSGISCEGRLVCAVEEPRSDSRRFVISSLYLPSHPGLADAWGLDFLASYFDVVHSERGCSLEVPHCFALVLSSIAAGSPWLLSRLTWRFSLRTLLAAMALVAAALGVLAWSLRG